MIKRKELTTDKPKKESFKKTVQKVKSGLSVNSLPNAIVDGVLVAQLKAEIIIEIFRNGKTILTVCVLEKIDSDGCLHLWNKTTEQWNLISINNPPNVFKLKT